MMYPKKKKEKQEETSSWCYKRKINKENLLGWIMPEILLACQWDLEESRILLLVAYAGPNPID